MFNPLKRVRDFNGSDTPKPFRQGIIMVGGVPHSSTLILMNYGIKTQAEQPNNSAALVPLTGDEAELLVSRIELEQHAGLLDEDTPPKPQYSKHGDRSAYGTPPPLGKPNGHGA